MPHIHNLLFFTFMTRTPVMALHPQLCGWFRSVPVLDMIYPKSTHDLGMDPVKMGMIYLGCPETVPSGMKL